MKIGFIEIGEKLFNDELKQNLNKIKESKTILKDVKFIYIKNIIEVKNFNFDLMYVHFFSNENDLNILKKLFELNKTHIVGITHEKQSNKRIKEVKKYISNLVILDPIKRKIFIQYLIHQLYNLFIPCLINLTSQDIIAICKTGFFIEVCKSNIYKRKQHPINPCEDYKSIKGIHILILGNNTKNNINLDDIEEIGELITTDLNKDTNIIWTFVEDSKLKGSKKYFEILVVR